jgi:HlyD family secretion protein
LFQRGANWQTFVVEGKSAKLQNVTIGRSNGLETEIVEGLGEGLRIIVYPGDQVTDGARIVAINGPK